MLAALLCAHLLLAPTAVVASAAGDEQDIPEPALDESGDAIWSDGAYFMSVHQLGKALDPAWLLQKARLLPPQEAEDVDALDEVPDSAWFTNRHVFRPLDRERLATGPGGTPPDGPWIVVKGKSLGITPGFVAKDSSGRLVFVKFDPPEYPGLGSNGDVIVSRLLHAAGYNVPEYYSVWLATASLTLDPRAMIPGKFKVKRPMTAGDLEAILAKAHRDAAGRVLADVSPILPGIPKGASGFSGLRRDDPNDAVLHENRRALRGLRVFAAWVSDTDRRRGNTLAMFVEEGGRRFLRHYQMDFSASFGSGNIEPKAPEEGFEYFFDPAVVTESMGALGLWVKPWERSRPVKYPEIGRFEAVPFDPVRWRGDYANPAFEKMTRRDAFWAARIVTAFTDEDLRVLIDAGYFPTPGAKDFLLETLIRRRDAIGRAWLETPRVSPLDAFTVSSGTLRFTDLGLARGLARPEGTRYRFRFGRGERRVTAEPAVPLQAGVVERVDLWTSRDGGRSWGRRVRLSLGGSGPGTRVASVER